MSKDEHELLDFMNIEKGATGDMRAIQVVLSGSPLDMNNMVHGLMRFFERTASKHHGGNVAFRLIPLYE